MTLATNVKRLREAKGMSQNELAAAAGISQQLVSQIENGKNTTTKHMPAVARALDVSIDQIDPAYATAAPDAELTELVSVFEKLDEEGRLALLAAARAMRSK